MYGAGEARVISNMVFEKLFQLQAYRIALDRFRILTVDQKTQLEEILRRLLTHEPVQYILQEADFYGLKFKVTPAVLIPRPETEELVAWIEGEMKNRGAISLLDIGTGSGCIPITLAKRVTDSIVEAVDISPEALAVAEENNRLLNAGVQFRQLDILTDQLPPQAYHIIVSNPPYILPQEQVGMNDNVLKYEPHLALFTPPDDGLIFYRVITQKALRALKPGGKLFFEINAANGPDVVNLMQQAGLQNVELRKDVSGNHRMVMGCL